MTKMKLFISSERTSKLTKEGGNGSDLKVIIKKEYNFIYNIL